MPLDVARRLARLGIERLDRGIDAEWFQNPQYLAIDVELLTTRSPSDRVRRSTL